MKKYNKKIRTYDKLIYLIIKHINSNDKLQNKFNHYNNKYKLEDLLKLLYFFRNINNFINITPFLLKNGFIKSKFKYNDLL